MAVLKVKVDLDKCIGSGHCVLTAPRIFDQNDDGFVVVVDACPPAELHAAAHKAADLCPAQAIVIEESP